MSELSFGCTVQGIVTDADVVWITEQVIEVGTDDARLPGEPVYGMAALDGMPKDCRQPH